MRFPPIGRISIALALLSTTTITALQSVGTFPSENAHVLEARKAVCESLAFEVASVAARQDRAAIRRTLRKAVERNPEILSAALRKSDGTLLAVQGDHERHWSAPPGDTSTPENAQVPLYAGSTRWGTVEVRFTPIPPQDTGGLWTDSLFRLLPFVARAS